MAAPKKASVEKPMDEMVSVYIERDPERRDEAGFYVSVNDVSYLLPYGKTSEVPRYIAEEIERSHQAKIEFNERQHEMAEAAKSAN